MALRKREQSIYKTKDDCFIKTMPNGFNSFYQLDFAQHNHTKNINRTRIHTQPNSVNQSHRILRGSLEENRKKIERIKTEMHGLRQVELNDYIKKSQKYQELLNLNDNNKKRLPTLNSKVGEVVKKSVAEQLEKNIQFLLTTNRYRIEGWKPESREGHTTIIFKNMAIILGGHCSNTFQRAEAYSFDTQSWTYWNKVNELKMESARSYHTAIFYKQRFVILFGGMGTYDISRKCRVCYSSVSLIDLQLWKERKDIKINNQENIEGRRSHSACLMGKYMLIFGGVNTKRQYLNDFVYLDLKQLRWYHKEYKIQGKELTENMSFGIAKHKAITYFRSHHKNYPLYSSEYSDHEGLLIFGGVFGNGEENIILQITFNKYNPILKRIQYSGIPPSSIEPIIEKFNQNLVIIISGQSAERAIRLYKIRQKEFVGISKFMTPEYFAGIGSTLSKYNNQFYFFFGMGENGYVGNVNSIKLEEKITESEVKKKKERTYEIGWKQQAILSDSSSDEF